MTEHSDLDRLFDESERRASGGKPGPSSPYGSVDPMEADHFLLKKSWDYFRARIRSIEDQWSQLVQSKEERAGALEARLAELQENLSTVIQENAAFREFEGAIGDSRISEQKELAERSHQMKQSWEAERESLERQVNDRDGKIFALKKEIERHQANGDLRKAQFDHRVTELQEKAEEHEQRLRTAAAGWDAVRIEQDERVEHLANHVDLLRAEVERRDVLIQQAAETLLEKEKTRMDVSAESAARAETIRKKEDELLLLTERMKRLEEENHQLRADWEQERADWRELWERNRSLTDDRKKSRISDENEES